MVALIVGLGNPGPQYAMTRHNIGFMLVDVLAGDYNFSSPQRKGKALFYEGRINNEKVFLLKPTTYMNLSGQAVQPLVSFYQIPLDRVFVVHDDLDLDPFKVRIKQGGGAGGHNGLKSLDSTMGKDYWRLRLGIGHPGDKDKVSSYVLNAFPKSDLDGLVDLLGSLSDHIGLLLGSDKNQFVSTVLKDLTPSS